MTRPKNKHIKNIIGKVSNFLSKKYPNVDKSNVEINNEYDADIIGSALISIF